MRVTVGRTYRFRATHSLPDFPEPWCFPHEHDYTVEIVAEGGTDTDVLDRRWRLLALTDDMNSHFEPSTVENIAQTLLAGAPPLVVAVTVWEDRQRYGRAER